MNFNQLGTQLWLLQQRLLKGRIFMDKNEKLQEHHKNSTYNTKKYSYLVLRKIPDINKHDYFYCCNQMAKLYNQINDPCCDNFRFCQANKDGTATDEYLEQARKGCCGRASVFINNEYTGNKFWFGFNYGH